ncbi:Pv-fam-d protein [Plasmodium ovale wallikeri]|uniref:Pv-fam-d protein n=2 Tax=Plasmodium ovale TaxID=36330 RepID=A0A1A8YJ80_PLAOA|nr:Pv-fam-d protein [Plasmodium ovale wallikeri]SBT59367.1 Pv-fam-d protein [Plasmodium ovale wallikeri]SBT73427.1 Plasmodium exported protein, unknown function [Plasmodium ovale]
MKKFCIFINILAFALLEDSWNSINNCTITSPLSWNNSSRKTKASELRVARLLSEQAQVTANNSQTTANVANEESCKDEGYDKDRYDALTEDYYNMMEEDINKNDSSLSVREIMHNIEPLTHIGNHIDHFSRKGRCSVQHNCKNFKKCASRMFKSIKNLDKKVEREMYHIIRSKQYGRSHLANKRKNMINKLKTFLYKYKVFSPVVISSLLAIVFAQAASYPSLVPIFAVTAVITFLYLLRKYFKCKKISKRIPRERVHNLDKENEDQNNTYV